MEGGAGDDTLYTNFGKGSVLRGGAGNDRYQIRQDQGTNQISIQDTAGIDRLDFADFSGNISTSPTLSLSLSSGNTGLTRQGTSLLIDINKDGIARATDDVVISDFFGASATVAGAGFIETVANLAGTAILTANLPDAPVTTPVTTPTPAVTTPTPVTGGPVTTPTPVVTAPTLLVGGPVTTPTPAVTTPTPATTPTPVFVPLPALTIALPIALTLTNPPAPTGSSPQTIGSNGNDAIVGSDANDILYGLKGNDILVGNGGDDLLFGGKGDDVLFGNNGNDLLFGNQGNDTVIGGDGNDTEFGGKGDDLLYGGDGNDVLAGDDDNNTLTGEAGNDSLYGGKDNDALLGGSGSDFLYAKEGNDILGGVDGSLANPGRGEIDTLIGAEGNDTFLLGDATKFYYNDGVDTGTGGGDYALIVGFNPIEDIIQLQGAPSTYVLGASPAGLPVGNAIFKKTAGSDELIAIVQAVSSFGLDSTSLRFV